MFGVLTLSNTMSSAFTELYSRAFGAADLVVTAPGDSGTFDEKVVEEIRDVPGVESAAPRLSLPASLVLQDENGLPEVQRMRLFGVEPESASLATGFDLIEGRYPEDGRELTLANKEYELLKFLMEHAGEVVEREEIQREVWGDVDLRGSKTLDMHMSWLRRKIGDEGKELGRRIATVRGVGFRYNADQ